MCSGKHIQSIYRAYLQLQLQCMSFMYHVILNLKGTKNNGRVFWIQHCIQSGERPGFNSRSFMLFCLLVSVAVLLLLTSFVYCFCFFVFVLLLFVLGDFWFSFFFIFFFPLNSRHQAGEGSQGNSYKDLQLQLTMINATSLPSLCSGDSMTERESKQMLQVNIVYNYLYSDRSPATGIILTSCVALVHFIHVCFFFKLQFK